MIYIYIDIVDTLSSRSMQKSTPQLGLSLEVLQQSSVCHVTSSHDHGSSANLNACLSGHTCMCVSHIKHKK